MSGGTSEESKQVVRMKESAWGQLKNTYSVGLLTQEVYPNVYVELQTVQRECKNRGWDGEDASPITPETIWTARQFLDSLPLGIRPPSVGAEPDGFVSFEWFKSSKHQLSISIGPEHTIYYACILGDKKANGAEAFVGTVPAALIMLIIQVGRG
jgi:hypothetical protein